MMLRYVAGTPKAVAMASLADCERRRGEAPVPMSCPDEDGLNEMTAAALVKLAAARQIAVGEDPEDKDSLIVAIRAAGPRPVSRDSCWHLGCILPRVPAMIVRTGHPREPPRSR